MRRPWPIYAPAQDQVFRTTMAFLSGRLMERITLDWAVSLGLQEFAQRAAVLEQLDRSSRDLQEPWRTAWRVIEESWSSNVPKEQHDMAVLDVSERLKAGERSGALVDAFVELVKRWGGHEGMSVFDFHAGLRTSIPAVRAVQNFLKAPNPSSGTEISHAKTLMILSVIQNDSLTKLERAKLVGNHGVMMSDAYYQQIFSNALSSMK